MTQAHEATHAMLNTVAALRAIERKQAPIHDDDLDFLMLEADVRRAATDWGVPPALPASEADVVAFRAGMLETATRAVAAAEFATRILSGEYVNKAIARVEPWMYFSRASIFPATGTVFSTMRHGSRWYERLDKGDTVRLAYTDDPSFFSRAEVIDLEHGAWEDLVDLTHTNHDFFGDHSEVARLLLAEQLTKIYGFSFDELDQHNFTLVFLKVMP